MTRAARAGALVPWIAVAFGLLLQLLVRPGVFYSGDGGVKYLLADQYTRGAWGVELRLPAEPWTRAIWDEGLYPLGPPFVYEAGGKRVAGQPVAFPALSAPFLRALGWRGLYALPLASLALLAWRLRVFTRRAGLGPGPRTVTEAGVLLASFVPLYAGAYWEHLPATALAWCGMAWMIEPPGGRRGALLAGAALGAAAWLRPEALLLASLVVGAALLLRRAGATPFVLGAAVPVIGFLAFNLVTYGRWLGAHGAQAGAPDAGQALVRSAMLSGRLLLWAPVAVIALVFVRRPRPEPRALLALSGVFLLVLGFLVPNQGGLQWGPRYTMVLVPALAAAAGMSLPSGAGWRPAGLLALGATLNLVGGTRDLAGNYAERVRPALQAVQDAGIDQVVVTDQHIAQEMASLMGTRRFYAFPWGEDLEARVGRLAERLDDAGKDRFLLVVGDYEGTVEPPPTMTVRTGRVEATGRLLGRYGRHYLLMDFGTRARGGA